MTRVVEPQENELHGYQIVFTFNIPQPGAIILAAKDEESAKVEFQKMLDQRGIKDSEIWRVVPLDKSNEMARYLNKIFMENDNMEALRKMVEEWEATEIAEPEEAEIIQLFPNKEDEDKKVH